MITFLDFNNKTKITIDMVADHVVVTCAHQIRNLSGIYSLKVIEVLTESVTDCFSNMSLALKERFPPKHTRFESGTRTSCNYDGVASESRVLADDMFLVDETLLGLLIYCYHVIHLILYYQK